MSRMIEFGAPTAPARAAGPSRSAEQVVSTGPSGLVLGEGSDGPVVIRAFRPRPTRLYLAVPDYVTWLLAFRAVSLGAHVSVVATERRRWDVLVEAIRAGGGTADLVGPGAALPARGRSYRPSLVIGEAADAETIAAGAWQAVAALADPTVPRAIHEMRAADLTVLAPCTGRAAEHLRRALSLGPRELRKADGMGPSDVVVAVPRHLERVAMPPTATEYRLLFAS